VRRGAGPLVAATALGLLALAGAAPARELPLARYEAGLARIEAALADGAAGRVRREAEYLAGAERVVAADGRSFAPDRSVLGPLSRLEPEGDDGALADRVRVLRGALADARAGAGGEAPDAELLSALRADQEGAGWAEGGDAAAIDVDVDETPWEGAGEDAAAAGDWFWDRLTRLGEWLDELFGGGGGLGLDLPIPSVLVAVAVALLLLGLAVAAVLRRRLPALADEAGGAAGPGAAMARVRDADPLSRTAASWEAYADELTAAGRRREALRAWYHAVLSRLLRTGRLRPRRGATNWEYVRAAPRGAPWRAGFEELTRRFDVEWYGRHETDAAELEAARDEAQAVLAGLRADEP